VLSFKTYQGWEDLEPFREDWNRLAQESAAPEVFQRYEWLKAWSRSGTRDSKMNVILAHDGNRLAAIAPLMFSTRRLCGVPLRTLEFIGTPNSDYSDFIYADDRYLPALWDEVNKTSDGVDTIGLLEIKESSRTCQFLSQQPGLIGRPSSIGLSARLPENPGARVSDYLKGSGIRERTLRRIESEGTVDLHEYKTPEAVRSMLPATFAQHIDRWAGTPTPSFFEQAAIRRLYENWAADLDGRISLWVLTLNDQPVATLYGFISNRKLIVHTITYSPRWRQFHCGLVCILKVMQTLRARGVEWIDFTRGTEDFKLFFADVPTRNYHFYALRDLKAKCLMGARIKAKDIATGSETLRRWAGRLGYRLDSLGELWLVPRRADIADTFGEGEVNMVCQVTNGQAFSKWAVSQLFHRFFWYLKEDGIVRTCRKTGKYLWRKVYDGKQQTAKRVAPVREDEVLSLQPGEWVEVKSKEEIQQMLDGHGKYRGMEFMPQMKRSCGQRFRVYKRMEALFLEETQQRRRVKNTVLLENSICDGRGVGCDRSCFFFWREAWLKRVNGPFEGEMVEAAGVEPASEMARRDKTTCVSGSAS